MGPVKCGGKRLFDTVREAKTALNTLKATSHRSKIPKRYYYCKYCKGYHLTSLKTNQKRYRDE